LSIPEKGKGSRKKGKMEGKRGGRVKRKKV